MTYIRLRSILLVAIAILLFGSGMVQATEQQQRASEEPSLLERYTSNAQDLILKGLELVGIKYRPGLQRICSNRFQGCHRPASATHSA